MGLEAVTYISDFDTTFPLANDPRSEGDDHIRRIKLGLKNSFPSITGAVNATQGELNLLVGIPAGSLLQQRNANKTLLDSYGLRTLAAGASNSFAVDLSLYNMVSASWLSGAALTITVSNRLDSRFCKVLYDNTSGGNVAVTWAGLSGSVLWTPNSARAAQAVPGYNVWEIDVAGSRELISILNSTTLNS